MNKLFKLLIIAVICLAFFAGCDNVKFNNTADKSTLLTEIYTVSQVDELKNRSAQNTITFSDFKKDFAAECVRKTYQGCYVVLTLDNNDNAFIFFDNENNLTHILCANSFKSKNEFLSDSFKQKTKSEISAFDSNSFVLPISAVDMTVHIVKEGVCLVKYSRIVDGQLLDDPIVDSVEFIDNDSIESCENQLIRDNIPFIISVDK